MNRAITAESYSRRLQRETAHIWDHLDEPLDLAKLADIACLSPYHFHRIYRAMLGETLGQTLSRSRLHRASTALVKETTPIALIAKAAGYGSVPAFSRAFRAAYKVTPTAFRRQKRQPNGGSLMPVIVETRPALRIAAVKHRGPPQAIGAAFDLVMAWAGPKGVAMPPAWGVAVYLSNMMTVPPEDQEALAGLTVGPEITSDDTVTIHEVPGGKQAIFLYKGPYAHIGQGYQELFGWLPTSGEERAHQPLFEINLNDPRQTAPEDLLTELCLPLK
jgi:AraC family transcriptional regulator